MKIRYINIPDVYKRQGGASGRINIFTPRDTLQMWRLSSVKKDTALTLT